MASQKLLQAEAEWKAKCQAMLEGISTLGLSRLDPQPPLDHVANGQDDSDNSWDSWDSKEQDVWDFIPDDEAEDFFDSGDDFGITDPGVGASSAFGIEWLSTKCAIISAKNGVAEDILQNQIVSLLSTGVSEEALQSSLIDLVGYDDFDFIIDLLGHRDEVLASITQAQINTESGGPRILTKAEREAALRAQDVQHKAMPLAAARAKEERYPHVYKSYYAGNTLSHSGQRYGLPIGSERLQFEKYEEYAIPAGRKGTLQPGEKLVSIIDMDGLCRGTFKGYTSLNRMQSLVYPVAYKTSENMLVCAPTGAGKTDASMLTALQCIGQYCRPNPIENPSVTDFTVALEEFKIVYVAPMKALAAEVTEKLGKRLAWLGIKCREYTGDMSLTKAEIVNTQIIVTTPEKWDVVTRKGTGDTELVQKVRLLIIDEVHMLHDERGAVLESLVARTQRQVESTQSLIRIVGLSATLPNYLDVADFLRVNRWRGLFYFDQSFRPVPLEQHFIGVKGKSGSMESRTNLDQIAFEKVKQMLERGHQVMVFVHSRRDTALTAKMLLQKATEDDCLELFDPLGHPKYDQAMRDLKQTKARDLREFIPKGIGIHHAGMARADRNTMERLFGNGVLKVLCCTATLAWGVNLPAAAVVIKGTNVYNAQLGRFSDLSILDVLQIFGRAGRPQFEDTGIGMICTTGDKLEHYLRAVTEQQPIESRFSSKLVDNLNAEISLGTVTNISEAVQWIGYSYLFVRMQRSFQTYNIEWSEMRDDPQLVQHRRKMAIEAAKTLQECQMIVFNQTTEDLRIKDLGRIASQYYIGHTTIHSFNGTMREHGSERDMLLMMSKSGEFDNIQFRDSESKELMQMNTNDDIVHYKIKSKGTDTSHGIKTAQGVKNPQAGNDPSGIDTPQSKTNILLQAYISRYQPEDFALTNDLNYIAQQSGRICRALFMIALNRRWGKLCLVLLTLAKSIERRIWSNAHPLNQFDFTAPVLRALNAKRSISMQTLREMEPKELGSMVHNEGVGKKLAKTLSHFPILDIEAKIAPLNRDVLRVKLRLEPSFSWNDHMHGTSESFYIWVENSETAMIYHHEYFIINRKKLYDDHELNFTIPLADPLPTQIYVRSVSDRWLGAETVTPVSFQHLIRPDTESVWTDLLNLQPLSIKALQNPPVEEIYQRRFEFFNPMQTQVFHTLYHTPANVLLGSPTGSGKTVAAELAMWWAFKTRPGSKVVYIAPMKALVRERIKDWGSRLGEPLGLKLVELTGDNTPDTRTINDADVIITTPEKWDGISRSWQTRGYVKKVSLVIIDEIHLLAGDRGPILEIIVSRMNYIGSSTNNPVRLLGMSTACANATDLANWLGVKEGGLFNFKPSVRPVPLEMYIDGFPEIRGFCPFMQSMNRPTFRAIKNHSPEKPVIVFVASRRQTRLTAKDLINFCGMEENPRRFLHMSEEDLQLNLARVKDDALKEAISFGIGLHHAGLVESDRQIAEELFLHNKIQILIATSTLAWGVNLPAHLVVVKGTQFFDAKIEAYKDMDLTDVLQMLGRAGRPQFDNSGVARIFTQNSKKDFYKHFLHTGFPVESSLHTVLDNHLCAEVSAETIQSKQDALDYLTWTFFFRRLHKNPTYYGLQIDAEDHSNESAQREANNYMVQMVNKSLRELEASQCVETFPNGDVEPTPLGKIMSYYYLSHLTIRYLVKHAKPGGGLGDALAWMSHAAEYDELPVRHNEELINAELSRNLPISAENYEGGKPLWDPHVKAFLLLQSHMSRIDLPISDYIGDQTSVLDQAIRIIQASIDVLTERGILSSCLSMIQLMQAIKSATWPSATHVAILPGVSESTKATTTLAEVAAMGTSDKLNALAKKLHVPSSQTTQFVRAASTLPHISVAIDTATTSAVAISLRRLNAFATDDARIFAPRFPKSQTEGWFIMLCDAENDEIVAVKRAGWSPPSSPQQKQEQQRENRNKPTLKRGTKPRKIHVTLKIPPTMQGRKLQVRVVSDAYIGIEQSVDVEIPRAPAPDGFDKKEKPAALDSNGWNGEKA
ncbi:Antiviral helicase SLH1 [Ceratocystis lukuohia]|uniref:Antiviral helicase SLH1 n=1 Tax=Ceratocystis lukuohia TaxID=2019550 RepID=A0ABR4MSL2_9PEZI